MGSDGNLFSDFVREPRRAQEGRHAFRGRLACHLAGIWAVPTLYQRYTWAASSSDFVTKSEDEAAQVRRRWGEGGELVGWIQGAIWARREGNSGVFSRCSLFIIKIQKGLSCSATEGYSVRESVARGWGAKGGFLYWKLFIKFVGVITRIQKPSYLCLHRPMHQDGGSNPCARRNS